ncbi:hypothetical protein KJ903_01230 [Patescibacteria group bacterium]|nr:hypothetical protein [Patescibacteria group bacterium]
MSAKKVISLLVVLVVILVGAGVATYYFLSREVKTNDSTVTKPKTVSEDDLNIKKTTGTEENQSKILYGKVSNHISEQTGAGNNCKSFTMLKYEGGGVVDKDSKENQDLDVTGYPLTYLQTKKNDNYFYVASDQSPVQEQYGATVFDWDLAERDLKSADFTAEESKRVIMSTADKFPSYLKTSPDNKYLVYVMTAKKENKLQGDIRNPRVKDSDLVIRDLTSGEEETILSGNYNRQLFDSFLNFSVQDNSLFTIRTKESGGLEFIKITLASGEIETFAEVFPDFDWEKTLWDDLLPSGFTGHPAHFEISPNENKLAVYKNKSGSDFENCAPSVGHTLWSFNIDQDIISVYDEDSGMIDGLDWKDDSKELAYAVITGGGCYPDYIDAMIKRMDQTGENKEILVTEKQSKILGLGWSPDNQSIVYSVYGSDFVSWLKAVDPKSKEIEKIISSEDTEGSVDKENPVTFNFVGWVEMN